ncbi:hypothetical protein QWY28_13440 [Nocardioides sp. SOB77]|uniref:Uncharacterized protein n=1 Tax=Nocardioides oceani TaxID=3058369 RepID=A0ABT8FGZ7_9ACTN|nr:hypothetical protein [Nocardioides oceani]MDN4173959.1 hypothetical protein [Nocardioides oceani]
MTAQDWTLVAAVAIAFCLLSAVAYLDDPDRKERRRQRRVEDLVALARATGVIHLDHTVCQAPDCNVVLCLDNEPCPGHAEPACTHLNFLCGDCRLDHCVDCRIDARHDAGVL